jgi:hypothetical protein
LTIRTPDRRRPAPDQGRWSNNDSWDEISAALSYGTVRGFKPGVLLALVVYIDGIRHL